MSVASVHINLTRKDPQFFESVKLWKNSNINIAFNVIKEKSWMQEYDPLKVKATPPQKFVSLWETVIKTVILNKVTNVLWNRNSWVSM
jgi:hypothetical protein